MRTQTRTARAATVRPEGPPQRANARPETRNQDLVGSVALYIPRIYQYPTSNYDLMAATVLVGIHAARLKHG